ncbi:conserved hypothetical protein [Capnocytophaga canimorsus]|uniref:DUF4304 domain-containing protein n=1 Tax=Capnocytophaga canimorsus TaxID=28188 RepID=A0A0B7IQT2_9FLAO|nr:hypothetical protein [Capnocytophaga canimorsus]CEN52969.1 conserved hypothetical protein [Capnocytophaga canimorsus]
MKTDYLKYIKDILTKNHFKLIESKEDNCIIYDYRKITNQVIVNISFLRREKRLKGFYYGINFIEMESIVSPILQKNELVGRAYKAENIDDSFYVEKEEKYNLSDSGVSIYESETIIEIFNLFYTQESLPFFEKWHNLNVLYEYIKDKESREELSEILGQFWQFKKATILRLCNDPNYQNFMDNFVKRREEILALRPDSVDVQKILQRL